MNECDPVEPINLKDDGQTRDRQSARSVMASGWLR
jgi:hypothetical protein